MSRRFLRLHDTTGNVPENFKEMDWDWEGGEVRKMALNRTKITGEQDQYHKAIKIRNESICLAVKDSNNYSSEDHTTT